MSLDLKQSMAKIRKALGSVLDRIMERYPPDGPLRACGVWACGWPSGDSFVKVTKDMEDAMAAQVIKDQGVQFRDVLVDVREVAAIESKEGQFALIVTERVQPLDVLDKLAGTVDDCYETWCELNKVKRRAIGPLSHVVERKFDRLREVERQLGIDLVHDAHPGNWGLRDPLGDAKARAESLVVFDFGLSGPPPVGLKKFKNPALTVKRGKVYADGVDLQKAWDKVKDENLVQAGLPAFLFGPDQHMLYLAKDEASAQAIMEAARGEAPDDKAHALPIYMDRTWIGGPGTLAMLWRYPMAKKHLIAAIKFAVPEGKIVITHMSVKPVFRRNKVNTLMIDFIREVFPGRELEFKDPTIDGSAFMKGYGK